MTEFLGITKLSQALFAMVEGLRNPGRVQIDMGTYGDVEGGVCYGCAATVTLQQLCGQEFDQRNIGRSNREQALGGDSCTAAFCNRLGSFEYSIDMARRGRLKALSDFFECPWYEDVEEGLPGLDDNYTEEELRQYELAAIELAAIELEKEGF